MNLSEMAKQLGKKGGLKNKEKGSEYFKRIGKKGLEKRWKKRLT